MGCFSFKCKKSGKPVNSSSFAGDRVHLFLLEKGKVIEYMFGNYDSYGRVFGPTKDPEDKSLTDTTSFQWKKEWGECVDLMFDEDKSNGIAAILDKNFDPDEPWPTTRSEDDPDQGWGRMTDTKTVDEPFHKTFYDEV